MTSRRFEPDDLAARLLAGERAALARSITLVESRKPEHWPLAEALLQHILPHTGKATRIGISGVPGVGKSTTIDSFGRLILEKGHRLAVLAVDPSSTRTGGSILGDKTRMEGLTMDRRAFIRPSPSAGTLGGVAAKTREAMLLCEAAGFDVVMVETVGTGQSETAVHDLVDTFLVLMLPGGGDELQGIKKGILEIADIVAVNKADGANADRARHSAAEYKAALHILTPSSPDWSPEVLTCSGLTGDGLENLWETIQRHRDALTKSGALQARRQDQQVRWMWTIIEDLVQARLRAVPGLDTTLPALEADVAAGNLAPGAAARKILHRAGILNET